MSLCCITKPLRSAIIAIVALALFPGCATHRTPQAREFVFGQDTLAFENQLAWEYCRNAQGEWSSRKREPAPDYSLHCFPMVRACREFFLNARFDPKGTALTGDEYRKPVRRIMDQDSRKSLPEDERVPIPGYSNLYSFSAANPALLKKECGTAASSYFQRGHWRMVFPFSRRERQQTAEELLKSIEANWPPIIHILVFPKLTINHAVLVYGAEQTTTGICFQIYDPNVPNSPGSLHYDRQTGRFHLPPTSYFPGGPVEVYEVFKDWKY